MTCFICQNVRKDKYGTECQEDDLELTEDKLKWKMFDGSAHEITIHRCKECLKVIEELVDYDSRTLTEKAKGEIEKAAKAVVKTIDAFKPAIELAAIPIMWWVAS